MGKRQIAFNIWWPERPGLWGFLRRNLIPHPGTLTVTLLIVAGLLWASSVGALPLPAPTAVTTSTSTIAYQGRLADADGNPLTGTYPMIFRLYDVGTGGVPLWEEQWTGSNSVKVSDGLFNVMLGSLTQIPMGVITGHDLLFLGITVGTDDEMAPRVQLGTVPFAVQALTVPDGSITTTKIADGAVTAAKLDPNLQTNTTRGFTPAVYSDRASPEVSEGLHRWPSSSQSRVNIAFKVPDDYVSGDLLIRQTFHQHDTGPGSVVKIDRYIMRFRKSDGAWFNIAWPVNADYTFVSGSPFRTFTIPAGSFEAGDLILVRELRHGDDPFDTAGRLDLLTVGIEYTGK